MALACRAFRSAALSTWSPLAPSSATRVQRHQRFAPVVVRAVHQAKESMSQTSSKDIIQKIKSDHGELDDYYNKYKSAVKSRNKDDALKWFNQFVWEVCRHSVSEELVLYPMLERLGEKGKDLAGKSRADHHKVKELLSEMESISDPFAFESKMDTMMKDLREHIDMEEKEDLKLVEENMSLSERETAGTTFALGKKIAPTHPHTAVPEKPVIIEAALGLLATPVDKLRDVFSSFPSQQEVNRN